jgi:hypothetical protein
MWKRLYVQYPLFLSDLMKPEFSRQIFETNTNITFHKTLQWQSRCFLRKDGRTEEQTNMTKVIVAFRNFAKAPKKNSEREASSH